MTTLYKHRVKCTTDNKLEYIWLETDTEPDKCPTNTSHTIDSSGHAIVDTRAPNETVIKEEYTPTGGNFKAETRIVNTTANSTSSSNFSWPFPISVLTMRTVTSDAHKGDVMNITVAPDTIVGVITEAASTSASTLTVSNTVIENIYKGYKVKISDGINTDDLGYVISVDKVNKQISIQTATTNVFAIGSAILMSVSHVENFTFGYGGKYVIGASKIGGAHVPANTIINVKYQRNDSTDIDVTIQVEFLY